MWQHGKLFSQIVPKIHSYVAGTLSNQQTTTTALQRHFQRFASSGFAEIVDMESAVLSTLKVCILSASPYFSDRLVQHCDRLLSRTCTLYSFLTIPRKSRVMIGTLPYVFGSCERRSKLTEEMCIPLRPIPREDSYSLPFLYTV